MSKIGGKYKTLVVLFAVLGLVFLAYFSVLNILIDKDDILADVLAGIEDATGYRATANNVELSVFPTVTLNIHDVRVDNSDKSSAGYFLQIDSIKTYISLFSVFDGSQKINKIEVVNPLMELEKSADGFDNWSFIHKLNYSDVAGKLPISDINIINGSINYVDSMSDKVSEIDVINILLNIDNVAKYVGVSGYLSYSKQVFSIDSEVNFNHFSGLNDFSVKSKISLRNEHGKIQYSGDILDDSGNILLNGHIDVDFSNVFAWAEVFLDDFKKSDNAKLAFSADVNSKSKARQDFTNIAIKYMNSDIRGNAVLQYIGDSNNLNINLSADAIDFSNYNFDGHNIDVFQQVIWKILVNNIDVNFNFKVAELQVIDYILGKSEVSGSIDGDEMVINQASLIDDEVKILLFGVISKSKHKNKIEFDGLLELLGNNFKNFKNKIAFVKSVPLNNYGGKFRSKSNVFWSNEQIILSALKFQAGDLFVSGGINISDDDSASQTSLIVNGLNLDGVVGRLLPSQGLSEEKQYNYRSYNKTLGWLDNISKSSVFELVLGNYTYRGSRNNNASLKLTIAPKRIAAKNINIRFGDIKVRGQLGFSQIEEVPKLAGKLYVSRVKLSSMFDGEIKKTPVPRNNVLNVWSNDKFNFANIKGFDVDLELGIGTVDHNNFVLDNMRAKVKADNGAWVLSDLKGDLWGGKLTNSRLSLNILSIPEISGSFSLQEVDADKLINNILSDDTFQGSVTFGGEFRSSGPNPSAWAKNLNGSFILQGQDVIVKGFDLSGVVQSIPSVKSVGDVINIVRLAMLKRKTPFSDISGSFFAENGVIRSPEFKLRSKHAIGTMAGEINLLTWNMTLNLIFQFITLSSKDTPSLGVGFANSLDDPIVSLDTRSLESFVARKKISKAGVDTLN